MCLLIYKFEKNTILFAKVAMTLKDEKVYEATTVEKLLESERYEPRKRNVFLYVCAITASLMSFGNASSVVWTSPVIAKLRTNNSEINPLGEPITTFEESLIAALVYGGAVIGTLCLGKLCDIIGRLKAMIILSLIQLVGTLMLAFSTNVLWYFISRLTIGLGMGAGISTLTVFLSEIAEDHNRGQIGCFVGLLFPLGNLYCYILGPWLPVNTFTVLCALPFLVLALSLISFIPESPVYLASRGKRVDAIKSLEKLRNKSASEIEKEYEAILNTLSASSKKGGIIELFKTRALRKGLLINVVGTLIMQFSGVGAIIVFAGPLFDAARTHISGNATAIMIGTVQLLSIFLATMSVERLGKRPLLLISSMGSGIMLFALGLFFYLRYINSPYIEYLLWLPLAAVLLYFVFYGVGLGAITPSLPAEISPSNVKAISSSIGSITIFLTGGLICMVFPIFIRTVGPTWCLWGFAVCCVMGFFFILFVIPEIKGKSIVEIQELLGR